MRDIFLEWNKSVYSVKILKLKRLRITNLTKNCFEDGVNLKKKCLLMNFLISKFDE